MPIVPDEKDWTWVLERPCPECGFDASTFDRSEVARVLRSNVAVWGPLLDGGPATERPDDATWSAVEYACHVRDVFRLYERRLGWMVDRDDPSFPNWDQDATAVEDRYADQDPMSVVAELEAAGESLADAFDAVPDGAWGRTGTRSDGARFTIDTFARYFIHDPVHHAWDVEQGYAALASGR